MGGFFLLSINKIYHSLSICASSLPKQMCFFLFTFLSWFQSQLLVDQQRCGDLASLRDLRGEHWRKTCTVTKTVGFYFSMHNEKIDFCYSLMVKQHSWDWILHLKEFLWFNCCDFCSFNQFWAISLLFSVASVFMSHCVHDQK